MKKMIIALMCTAMTLAASAQPNNDDKPCPQGDKPCCMMHGQPRHHKEMQHGKRAFHPQTVFSGQIIDMPVIRSLNLDSVTINAVRELKRKKTEEMHALMADIRQDKMMRPEMKKDDPADSNKKAKDDKKIKKDKKKDKKDKEIKAGKATEGQGGNGQGDDKERREAFKVKMKENREKMQALRQSCRAELRKTLGDEKYIEYLEKKQEAFSRAPRGHRR